MAAPPLSTSACCTTVPWCAPEQTTSCARRAMSQARPPPAAQVWLGEALHNHTDLEMLDLHHTKIGDDDAIALAEGLKNNDNLRRLGAAAAQPP